MLKEKVLAYCSHVEKNVTGLKVKETDPQYKAVATVMTEVQAEVGLGLAFREPRTAEEVAALVGKPVDLTRKTLEEMSYWGFCVWTNESGEDRYFLDVWVPVLFESMAENHELTQIHPEVGHYFNEYTNHFMETFRGFVPIGAGPMRVIPVEKAISGNMQAMDFEHLSHYVEMATDIAIGTCSCRRVRALEGEGTGILQNEKCITLNRLARWTVKTGRGRAISKQECYDILRQCEKEGLMHEVTNVAGKDEVHAICNCEVESCFALRSVGMYKDPDIVRSNYVAQIDREKCVACGQCVETCPANALRLGQKIHTKNELPKNYQVNLPRNHVWGNKRYDPNYRINRKLSLETGTSPCKVNCPAHIAVQGYVQLAGQGKYTDALELIKKENPFPAVCGRICPRYCETACTRGNWDEPLAVDEIKKFIADQDLNTERRFIPEKLHHYPEKIAIIGGGPAGLSCAYFLAEKGYDHVTVFEKQPLLGGMLTLGIPSFRLDKGVVNAEIDILRELGVTFKTGVEVGKDISIAELRREGYKGFYLAIGAQGGRRLGVEGEDAEGVINGIDFLRAVNLGHTPQLGAKVVVIGGGNVAVDVSRTAARSGEDTVAMYCLESRDEMPALPEELEEAEKDHVSFHTSWGPKRILTKDGKVCGVEFKKCTRVFDEFHKFHPMYDEAETITVPADTVLLSIGQSIQWGHLTDDLHIRRSRQNTILASSMVTFQTDEKDIFTGGDVLTGPRFAIDAIAAGKEAAISLHRYVQEGQDLVMGRIQNRYFQINTDNVDYSGFDHVQREQARYRISKANEDNRVTFTEEQVKQEASRCLSCGSTWVDQNICIGCGLCTTRCKFDAISLTKRYNAAPDEWNHFKPKLIRNAVARGPRIVVTGVKETIGGQKQDVLQ